MLKKPDVLEKNKFHIRVQHPQIYQKQLVLSLSFFLCCTVLLNWSKTKILNFIFTNSILKVHCFFTFLAFAEQKANVNRSYNLARHLTKWQSLQRNVNFCILS